MSQTELFPRTASFPGTPGLVTCLQGTHLMAQSGVCHQPLRPSSGWLGAHRQIRQGLEAIPRSPFPTAAGAAS